MVGAGEVGEVVGAEFAGRWSGVAGGEEGVGKLVGTGGFDEVDVRMGCRRKHRRDGAPAGGDDGEVVGEGFDEGERLGFVGVGGGVAEDVGGGEERVFFGVVGEADVADDVGAEGDDLGEKSVLVGDGGEAAGDGEAKGVGLATVGDGDRGEEMEEAFSGRAEAEIEEVGGRMVLDFEFWVEG